jgi:hypothetical protein
MLSPGRRTLIGSSAAALGVAAWVFWRFLERLGGSPFRGGVIVYLVLLAGVIAVVSFGRGCMRKTEDDTWLWISIGATVVVVIALVSMLAIDSS